MGVNNRDASRPDLRAALVREPTGSRPRLNADGTRLRGARCRNCSTPAWPGRSVCHGCGSADLIDEDFAPTGALLTFTTVHVPRPGLPSPYVLGQVRLDGHGPIVFGHVRHLNDVVDLPARVRVASEPGAIPWYWFDLQT
jgi:uncharacterized OB-fold protein